MESLAYIHMALEYEKALPTELNNGQFGCQEQSKNKGFLYQKCEPFKMFRSLLPKAN